MGKGPSSKMTYHIKRLASRHNKFKRNEDEDSVEINSESSEEYLL